MNYVVLVRGNIEGEFKTSKKYIQAEENILS